MTNSYVLKIKCPDQVGLVAAVAGLIAAHKGWILEAKHHADAASKMFYMRQEIAADSLTNGLAAFKESFSTLADSFSMEWSIHDMRERQKIMIAVSKEEHCLSDILYRWRSGEYHIDIVGVLSNHETMKEICDWHKIPFIHTPIRDESREADFKTFEEAYVTSDADVLVLARFMQILPADMCDRGFGEIINIHHSFLPSFMGANPYRQASERGVKLIGATCHYVTPDLDAGPIIDQDVIRVNHEDSVQDMQRLGRDIEKVVLSRGLRYHLDHRVHIHGNKTIVFS
jgi:formyltetrahydrofolate deformylase